MGKELQCPHCLKNFRPSKQALTEHIRTHTGEKPYECNLCGKRFAHQSAWRSHVGTHTGEKRFKCQYCSYSTQHKTPLRYHEASVHKDISGKVVAKNFPCRSCPAKFKNTDHLTIHERTHSGEKPIQCSLCPKGFRQRAHLKRHILTHTGEKPHQCDLCMRRFRCTGSLKKHICSYASVVNEKPFNCSHCSFKAAKLSYVRRHEKIHSDTKRFECSQCTYSNHYSKAVVKKHEWRYHQIVHSDSKDSIDSNPENAQGEGDGGMQPGGKPYKCGFCCKVFQESKSLRQHIRVHTREKPYNCMYCNYCSTGRSQLKTHMRTHTGEKPYECYICNYATSHSATLKVHILKHQGSKPHECMYCNKRFFERGKCMEHMRIHTGEKPYRCRFCSFSSAHMSSKISHEKMHLNKSLHACSKCTYSTARKRVLFQHMQRDHQPMAGFGTEESGENSDREPPENGLSQNIACKECLYNSVNLKDLCVHYFQCHGLPLVRVERLN